MLKRRHGNDDRESIRTVLLSVGLLQSLLRVAVGVEERDDLLVLVEHGLRRRHQSRRRRRRARVADTVDVLRTHAELVALVQLQVAHLAHRLGDVVVELNRVESVLLQGMFS